MSYPPSLLVDDESIVFDVRHHPFFLFRPAALLTACLAAWILLMVFFTFFRGSVQVLVGLALLFVLACYLAWRVAVWRHIELVLTDRRLIYRSGVVTRHSREIPLSKINDVTSCQMVLGRLFSMGDLVVESASESGQCAFFDLRRPELLKIRILEVMHRAQGQAQGGDARALAAEVARAVKKEQPTEEFRPLPPERPPLYSEIVDQIERLDAMRQRGVLSEAEFEEAKRGLLARLSDEERR